MPNTFEDEVKKLFETAPVSLEHFREKRQGNEISEAWREKTRQSVASQLERNSSQETNPYASALQAQSAASQPATAAVAAASSIKQEALEYTGDQSSQEESEDAASPPQCS